MGGKVLGESYGSPHALKTTMEAFIKTWNDLYAHPFRWTYDGKALPQKAVIRFTQMLELSADTLDTRLLTKQLLLMANLLRDYHSEIEVPVLNKFRQVFVSQYQILLRLIEKERGPVKKKNAEIALASLLPLAASLPLQPEACGF